MSWTNQAATSGGGNYTEAPPAGSHAANVVALIDLGTQDDTYPGAPPKKARKVFIVWELCNEFVEGTKNRHLIGRAYTLSAHEKSGLRGMLESWRGKKYAEGEQYDLEAILGKPCILNLVHGESNAGRTFAKVNGVAGLPKGMTADKPSRPVISRECTSTDPLPDWIPYIIGEDPREVIDRAEENRPKSQPRPAGNGKHTSADANVAYPPNKPAQQTMGSEAEIPF